METGTSKKPSEIIRDVAPVDLVGQIIFALSGAVEAKDRYTNGHSQRVANYAREMARRFGCSEEDQRSYYYAGMLHDVGKIRISNDIINKTTTLTTSEFDEMKLHTMAGYYILKEVNAISAYAVGARWHHERYDGLGYPNGLEGENIPLLARVIAIADAYDAMTSNRSYRVTMTQAEVRREIEAGLGSQFDPVLGKIMLDIIDEDRDFLLRESGQSNPHTILAVDDNPMVLHLLEFILRGKSGFQLLTAGSGRTALSLLEHQAVELVLLDVEMPEMDGFEVLSEIRRKYGSLPVTFMTGDKDLDIIEKAESMGVSDYLTKPLVTHILWESIHNVLSTQKYRSSMQALERSATHE